MEISTVCKWTLLHSFLNASGAALLNYFYLFHLFMSFLFFRSFPSLTPLFPFSPVFELTVSIGYLNNIFFLLFFKYHSGYDEIAMVVVFCKILIYLKYSSLVFQFAISPVFPKQIIKMYCLSLPLTSSNEFFLNIAFLPVFV